jgi:amidase
VKLIGGGLYRHGRLQFHSIKLLKLYRLPFGFRAGRVIGNLHSKRSSSAVTAFYNFTGQPAISRPLGIDQSGLPDGMQVVAAIRSGGPLLRLAAQLEESLP